MSAALSFADRRGSTGSAARPAGCGMPPQPRRARRPPRARTTLPTPATTHSRGPSTDHTQSLPEYARTRSRRTTREASWNTTIWWCSVAVPQGRRVRPRPPTSASGCSSPSARRIPAGPWFTRARSPRRPCASRRSPSPASRRPASACTSASGACPPSTSSRTAASPWRETNRTASARNIDASQHRVRARQASFVDPHTIRLWSPRGESDGHGGQGADRHRIEAGPPGDVSLRARGNLRLGRDRRARAAAEVDGGRSAPASSAASTRRSSRRSASRSPWSTGAIASCRSWTRRSARG